MVDSFKKIGRASLVQAVIDRLTSAMVDGMLKPGDKIPTEMELSEQLGVARNTVREAIKILVYMGVLEIRRPDGTFVSDGFTEQMIDPMIYGIILNQKNENELQELRAMTEAGVLNIAIHKCTDEEVEVLKGKLEDLREALLCENPDVDNVFKVDNAFHATIVDIASNSMISKINAVVMMLTNSTRYNSVKYMIEHGRNEELFNAHEKIYDMVEGRKGSHMYDKIQGTYFLERDE